MAKPGARIILAARFTFFCMEIGLAKSFGVLVPELEEQLQTSNAIIGLITSLSLATMYLGSPIAKILIHQLPRPRMLTTLSGLAGGCALIATAFTRNLVFLGLLFMFVGLCCSVVNLQALVLLHDYYQEEFPFASCISVLGIPFGAVVLPPITEKLLEQYGLSGTLMVVGALVLNMIPIGLVLKVPRTRPGGKSPEEKRELDPFMLVKACETQEYVQIPSAKDMTSDACPDDEDTQGDGHSTMVNGRRLTGENESMIQRDGPVLSSEANTAPICDTEIARCPQSAEDTSLYTGRTDKARQLSHNSKSSSEDIRMVEGSIISSCLSIFHFDVLIKEPLFSILLIPSTLLSFLVTGGWVLFVVLYAVEHGIDIARGTYLTTSGAVGGIVSSILMSIGLRYRPEWSPLYLLWNQALQTVVFFLQILYSSYSYLMVMSFLIGFGLFGHNVTIEAVLSEVVQSKNFPDACSVFYLIVGIGYIGSGYIAGFVRDQTGNIELLFVFLGATSMASCGLILLIVILMRRKPNLRSLDSVQKEDQKSDEARRV
ncbi:monocarboxylate transporter 9 isoform X1 [Strongylocentrotus purpuratus]|uniref:Monocarboxylate transporter n=1 Tax=Strongylocentrotus purpuratus TaxID=7668 RepID=A0A7M7RFF3_STRPU|nr:monocarboxylate transporter 9 isoform X1 [Strongylocentrotus purpuratus]